MKIKIELTKTEAGQIKKATKTVSKELVTMFEEDPKEMIEFYKSDIEGNIDTMFNKSAKGKFGTYESETDEKGNVVLTVNVKGIVVKDLTQIIRIFYSSLAKFIKSITEPIIKFIEKSA